MKRRLVVRPLAMDQLEELAAYIGRDSLNAAERLRQASVAAMHDLLEWPLTHDVPFPEYPALRHLRRVRPKGFPNHVIYYTLHEDAMEVVCVLHGHRNLPSVLIENV